jgi:homoserine kinase
VRVAVFRTERVRVVVPATSANLGPGFDTFGLALTLEDEVSAEVAAAGVTVAVTGEGAGEVPSDGTHLVVASMLATFTAMGVQRPPGLRLDCRNRIPHARGLGSSAAAVVAGILLARGLVPDGAAGLDAAAALQLAAALEGHPDNVAACLLGGLTLAWTGATGARAVRLPVADSVLAVLFVPTSRGLTAQARAALPEMVPHADAAFNVARGALLLHALRADPQLLFEATEDRLHQPYREAVMPRSLDLVRGLRARGVAATVSGAGPSVLALVAAAPDDATAAGAGDSADPAGLASEAPPGWSCQYLRISPRGGRIVDARHAEGDPVAAGLLR